MTVQPWEPVSHKIELEGGFLSSPWDGGPSEIYRHCFYRPPVSALHVTLANGQKIIVRAKR